MNIAIDLPSAELALVGTILRRHLPESVRVFVFGSRVSGTARRYSDLDLALDDGKPLGLDIMASLSDAFSESVLPFKVDVIDLQTVDPGFRSLIEPTWIALPFKACP